MHSQLEIERCDPDTGTEERVGKVIALLGVVITVLAIVTVVAGLYFE